MDMAEGWVRDPRGGEAAPLQTARGHGPAPAPSPGGSAEGGVCSGGPAPGLWVGSLWPSPQKQSECVDAP